MEYISGSCEEFLDDFQIRNLSKHVHMTRLDRVAHKQISGSIHRNLFSMSHEHLQVRHCFFSSRTLSFKKPAYIPE